MVSVWSCVDAGMMQAVAQLARATPSDASTVKPQQNGKVKILTIAGVMTKHGLTDPYRGSLGTSTAELTRLVDQARTDPNVAGVIFQIDSPGGAVSGLVELADAIRELSLVKPTVAHVYGLCASAAYFAASQTRTIVASRGSWLGGIGTYAVVVDVSRALERSGVEVIPITTSELKVAGLPGTKLTDPQRTEMQRIVDLMQSHFDAAVSSGRRLTGPALAQVRTGSIHPADIAIRFGLADRIGSFDSTLPAAGWTQPEKQLAYVGRPRNTALPMHG